MLSTRTNLIVLIIAVVIVGSLFLVLTVLPALPNLSENPVAAFFIVMVWVLLLTLTGAKQVIDWHNSPEQRHQREIEEGRSKMQKCPQCGSLKLGFSPSEDSKMKKLKIHCYDCGTKWAEEEKKARLYWEKEEEASSSKFQLSDKNKAFSKGEGALIIASMIVSVFLMVWFKPNFVEENPLLITAAAALVIIVGAGLNRFVAPKKRIVGIIGTVIVIVGMSILIVWLGLGYFFE